MGVIFAALFSGLTERPSSNAPVTIVQTREVYVTRIIETRGQKSKEEEGGGIVIAAGIALIFVLWKYAIHVELIHQYIGVFLLTALSFSFVTILLSYYKGQFTSDEWWVYILSPFVILMLCLYLFNLAHTSFNTMLTELAIQYNFWEFYTKALNDYGRNFMMTHVAGVLFLCFVILFSSLALLHYLALMNQRSGGAMYGLWSFLTRSTMVFSRKRWLVASALFIVAAHVGIEPNAAASWLTNR
jgi:hypothetical protein